MRSGGATILGSVACLIGLTAGTGAAEEARLQRIAEIGRHIFRCWRAPQDLQGITATLVVRLAFRRDGTVMGPPRVTFADPPLGTEIAASLRRAAEDTIARCTPVPFSPSLGGAIAGRPLTIRFDARIQ